MHTPYGVHPSAQVLEDHEVLVHESSVHTLHLAGFPARNLSQARTAGKCYMPKKDSTKSWLMQVVKPREEYVMVIDADSILRKPFIPEELHLELG